MAPQIMPFLHPDNFIEIIFDKCEQDFLDEERRLFYVALTRTKDKLYYIYDNDDKLNINLD
jgi:superfamily I DNA/RNA helicase